MAMLAKIFRSLSPLALATTALTLIAPAALVAQAASQAAPSLITNRLTQPIDENSRVTIKGTVHPLARAANDRGAAPDSMPLDRLQLILRRSDAQESALKQLVDDLHTPGSASYHKWLTPEQFGKQFGPSDQDVATVESWLQSHGFSVTKVNGGRQSLEISGNVAQFRSTFHAQIHKYMVNGETHYANATDPQIPAALAPVVGGFATLNNFHVKNHARVLGKAIYDPKTDKATPEWTTSSGGSIPNFVLSPADYAVQYDLNPLYQASTPINGTGQTIAIVNDSNINIYLVNQFRTLFSLPANPPQVIINGNDPGIDGINNPGGPNGDSVEAYLDVEWAGAVAPNATVNLVIAADTALEGGLYLALEHAIYGNLAPIVSLSFGNCEKTIGTANQFLNSLYEQAAAQGITVLVSTGDNGSAGCDDDNTQFFAINGQQVSGFASTPYNVAVGGTDFFYSDYNNSAALPAQLATYWNTTTSDNTPAVSIKGVIPEQPWNDSQFGLNIFNILTLSSGMQTSIAGGSGGASNCATGTYDASGNTLTCTAGYPRPVWQTGAGVPAGSVRLIPDVSLFAADFANSSFYPICAVDGDCQLVSSSGTAQITGVGGTSASTPSFAGIMALVNQKYGPQGQANFVLYPLAAQFPAAFHDVTNGTNSVPCNITTTTITGSAPVNCIAVSNPVTITDPTFGSATEGQIGSGTTPWYNATAGYDPASGLGTIDANVLVSDWSKVTFAASTVTLSSPAAGTYTHGSNITVTATVTGTTPTGDVALVTDSTLPTNQSRNFFTLTGGTATGTTNTLPGGTYNVWGSYGGDSKNAAADSAKTLITVSPEASGTLLNVFTPNGSGGYVSVPTGSTNIPYGTKLLLSAQVAPSSQLSAVQACQSNPATCPVFGPPTGVVTFSDSGTAVNAAVLNAEGDAEYNPSDPVAARVTTSIGNHSITASYPGDASYNASNAAATTYTVIQATPTINLATPNQTVLAGQATTFTILLETTGVGVAPTGTITVSGAPSGTPTSVPLSLSGVDLQTRVTASYANITVPATVTANNYNITFTYSGDINYTTAQASGALTVAAASTLTPSTTTIATSGAATSPSALTSITVTVTGKGTTAPTGSITLQTSGYEFNPLTLTPVTGTDTSEVTILVDSSGILQGANILIAGYSGDTVYAPSTSTATNLANPLSDFSMVPQTTIINVPSSGTATDTINISSVNGFAGVVALTCAGTGGVGCSVSSSPTLTSGGTSAVTLTVNNSNVTTAGSNFDVLITGVDPTGTFVHTLGIRAIAPVTTLAPGFTLTGPSGITVVNPGDTGTGTLTVAPVGGLTGAATFTCSIEGPAVAGLTCNAPNTTIALGVNATSTLSVVTTASTPQGSYTADVTATAGGITSPIVKVAITVNAAASFALSGNPTSLTLTAGATTGNTSTISITPANSFTGLVNLSCALTTSPAGATKVPTCSIAGSVNVTGTTAATSTLTVSTTAPTTSALDLPLNKFFAVGGGIAIAGLLFFGIPARRRSWRTILGVILFAVIVGLGIGCGGGGGNGGGGGGGGTTTPGTTAGAYVVTVTGTDAATGKLMSSTPVNVTVN
jgi:hypothetical protein